jgi:hypothetical protein
MVIQRVDSTSGSISKEDVNESIQMRNTSRIARVVYDWNSPRRVRKGFAGDLRSVLVRW